MSSHDATALIVSSTLTLIACLIIGAVLAGPGKRARGLAGAVTAWALIQFALFALAYWSATGGAL